MPVEIPAGVKVDLDGSTVTVKGPKAKAKVSELARTANPSETTWKGNTLRLWWD
jgi:ribosomal protein L6P/L9E